MDHVLDETGRSYNWSSNIKFQVARNLVKLDLNRIKLLNLYTYIICVWLFGCEYYQIQVGYSLKGRYWYLSRFNLLVKDNFIIVIVITEAHKKNGLDFWSDMSLCILTQRIHIWSPFRSNTLKMLSISYKSEESRSWT